MGGVEIYDITELHLEVTTHIVVPTENGTSSRRGSISYTVSSGGKKTISSSKLLGYMVSLRKPLDIHVTVGNKTVLNQPCGEFINKKRIVFVMGDGRVPPSGDSEKYEETVTKMADGQVLRIISVDRAQKTISQPFWACFICGPASVEASESLVAEGAAVEVAEPLVAEGATVEAAEPLVAEGGLTSTGSAAT